jgi:ABC-type multidrug transport system ATPase subunit
VPGDTLLSARGIVKQFGRRRVLDGASIEVVGGEAVAVVGENGVGKTTLLKICAGLVRPDGGQVTTVGRIGYCPQEPGLLELLTGHEHLILFGGAVGLARGEALAEGRRLLRGLGAVADAQTVARDLSGGERQKLNLTLALLGSPRLLLLDEPYQGFDLGAYIDFWEHVDGWRNRGIAVVVVTHLLTDHARVDRVIELPALR